jgi:hypothetical protein
MSVILVSLGMAVILGATAVHVRKAIGRRSHLRRSGQLLNWVDFERNPGMVRQIIQTNFGYGREVWAIYGQEVVDSHFRVFTNASLLLHAPAFPEVATFAEQRGIEAVRMLIKS